MFRAIFELPRWPKLTLQRKQQLSTFVKPTPRGGGGEAAVSALALPSVDMIKNMTSKRPSEKRYSVQQQQQQQQQACTTGTNFFSWYNATKAYIYKQ